jgi:acetylornithine/N-succinyldiaminopimelate aminotransferase
MFAVSSSLANIKNAANNNSRQLHQFSKILYNQYDILINRGKGSVLHDSLGNDYIDFHGMYGAVPFGHAPDEFMPIFDDLKNGKLPMTFGAFPKSDTESAAEKLAFKTAESIGGKPEDYQVYFNNTGAEANEAAVKFVKQHAYRCKGIADDEKIIISSSGNFHGRTTVGTSLFHPDKKLSREGFGPLLPGIEHIKWNNSYDVMRVFNEKGDKIAGIITEVIQGEGGIVMPDPNFIKTIAQESKKYGIPIITDEVQSGLHRAGPFWASELYKEKGFAPDIITSAKALGGGVFPVAAVIMKNEIANEIQPGMHGSTFGGNAIAMAVANKTLDIIEEQNIKENVEKQSSLLSKQLCKIKEDNPDVITDITGSGLWRGIKVNPELSIKNVSKTLIDNGVITGESGSNVLRVAPALNVNESDLNKGTERLAEGFYNISKNINKHIGVDVFSKANFRT